MATSVRNGTSSTATGRDRPNSRGDATRLRILLKAEELFAERGIAAVPLRDIGLAAGQRNNVAVQYHFGDRDNLVREVTAYRAAFSEEMRVELLAEMLHSNTQPDVFAVVHAFVESLVGPHMSPGNHYLAFLSRYSAEYGTFAGLRGTTRSASGSTLDTFSAMLRRINPHLPDHVVEERWMLTMTSTVNTLARYQAARRAGALPAPLHLLIEDMTSFLAAGIEAPLRTSVPKKMMTST